MSDQELNEFLHHLNSIHPLSSDSRRALMELVAFIPAEKQEILQPIGKTCRTIYFVHHGAARIYYYKEEKDVTEYFAFDRDIIIRAESLFTGKPSNKGIQAIEPTTFVALAADPLFGLFDLHRDIERLFYKLVEKSYCDTLQRLEHLQFRTAEERYRVLMSQAPRIIQKIPLKYIASYLGITQVSLSRIRAQLG